MPIINVLICNVNLNNIKSVLYNPNSFGSVTSACVHSLRPAKKIKSSFVNELLYLIRLKHAREHWLAIPMFLYQRIHVILIKYENHLSGSFRSQFVLYLVYFHFIYFIQ